MSLLDETHSPSFKGVPFLVLASNITGGRKDVRHSFLNSDRQSVEDLGLAPRVFNLTAVVTGDNYLQDRNRLLAALEGKGPGVLVHPLYGTLNDYVARTYTLVEDFTALGEARFSIVFEVSDSTGVPVKTESTLRTIEAARDAYIVKAGEDLTANYEVTPAFTGNFTAATDKLTAVEGAFAASASVRKATADRINAFNSAVTEFGANGTSLVQTPETLATSIQGLFTSMVALYADPSDTAIALGGLETFGDDDTRPAQDTASRIERTQNADIINAQVQSIALSHSYFSTAQSTFETVAEIDERAASLELQYDKQVNAEGLADDTKSALTDLRTAMQTFFDEQRVTARQELEVSTPLTSARLLAYAYYSDSGQGELLIALNQFREVSFVEGQVKVLTA